MNHPNPFVKISEISIEHAKILAYAVMVAHCENDVYAALRMANRLTENNCFGYLDGKFFENLVWEYIDDSHTTTNLILYNNLDLLKQFAQEYLEFQDGN